MAQIINDRRIRRVRRSAQELEQRVGVVLVTQELHALPCRRAVDPDPVTGALSAVGYVHRKVRSPCNTCKSAEIFGK